MATSISSEEILTEKDAAKVASELVEAQNKSSLLGFCLKLPPHEVEKICRMYPDPMEQLTQVIICFTRSADPKPTWGLIVSALENPMVNLTALAVKVKANHLPSCSSLDSSTSSTTTAESSRKRKSEQQSPEEPVKKPLLNAKEFNFGREVRSTHCSENIVKGAVTVHNDKVYFASGSSIHVLNTTNKKPYWLPKIELNRTNFGLTTINDNMLLAVGGKVNGEVVSSVMCYAVNNSSTPSTWIEKYPNMAVVRFDPEVVHYNNYVIVIAGWTKDHYFQEPRAELSVEILSLNKEQWYLIKGMQLPGYLDPMSCMSACVCNDTLYLTAKHRDANYYHNRPPKKYNDEEDQADPYQCFSFFQCIINDFTQMDSFTWHPLNHPHDVTYSVSDTAITYGNDCRFSLLCIGVNLFAIGCDHIEAVAPDSLQESLKLFYKMYASIDGLVRYSVQGTRRIMLPEPHCAIHLYDPDMDTWKKIHMIDDFGLTSAQPLVAVVDDRLVIVRSSNACLLHLM